MRGELQITVMTAGKVPVQSTLRVKHFTEIDNEILAWFLTFKHCKMILMSLY